MVQLIGDETVLYRSPSPNDIFCYTPGLAHGFNGRIFATFDFGGPGTEKLSGPRSDVGDYPSGNQVRVTVSDDHGQTWKETGALPMVHPIPFKTGKHLYIIGHSGRLLIARSDDNGETWSSCSVLEANCRWHQSAGRIDVYKGRVTLVYEQHLSKPGWPRVSPVLMSADENADLCNPSSWKFSEPFDPEVLTSECKNIGTPHNPRLTGALETNVFRIYDPNHLFFDPSERTVILAMRAETGNSNFAGFLKGIDDPEGELRIETLEVPSGQTLFLHPFPGGEMKFHMDYDPETRLYWLVSSQVVNSYLRREASCQSGEQSYNSRSRLRLSFSKNGFDWCHAGMIAMTSLGNGSRHYASLLIDGEDLLVLSRSGDEEAKSPHDGNLITLHRIKDFRNFSY